ncbi:hypothetical protein BDQ12DRAFT_670320 [Crucibulum laeve]|uniref:Uncharacterized protein n=1 Tax=Crucibulum laeve TaxID=68775 RepID=A0A5C3LKM5_9AGAR|nr:hypothetical protein BDQ12DRAFT_670320 [Crucibulum laeve]
MEKGGNGKRKGGAEDSLTLSVFALREFGVDEEIVAWLGQGGQLSGILHTLAASFAAVPVELKAKDWVIMKIAVIVDRETMRELWDSDGLGHSYLVTPTLASAWSHRVDLGLLVEVKRVSRAQEKMSFSERDLDNDGGDVDGDETEAEVDMYSRNGELTRYSVLLTTTQDNCPFAIPSSHLSMHLTRFELRPPNQLDRMDADHFPKQLVVVEEEMPPKMRKRWIHKEVESVAGSGVATAGPEIMQTGPRVVIHSKGSFAELSLLLPAIRTPATRRVRPFSFAAATVGSPTHSWCPFKRVKDVRAGGGAKCPMMR